MRCFLTLLAVVAALLAGCGEDEGGGAADASSAEAGATAAETPAMRHIHGLAMDPEGRALLVATHDGLWRAEDGSTKATRVGEEANDLMGFTVTDGGDYLASGHPAEGTPGPPALGLLRSNDDGRTWTPVSLAGEADFHALRASDGRLYGADTMSGLIYASPDGGRTWQRRRAPGPPIDLAVHPDRPDELLVTTEAGVARSTDGGRTWRPISDAIAGLLAWPEADRVLAVDGAGRLSVSADGGSEWTDAGDVGGQPVAFMVDGDALYVALADGAVKRSGDGGRTWELRAQV